MPPEEVFDYIRNNFETLKITIRADLIVNLETVELWCDDLFEVVGQSQEYYQQVSDLLVELFSNL